MPGIEFVPMFWSNHHLTPENLVAVSRSPATHVLGFNEPDMDGQSDMPAEECLAFWPRLMSLKQRLGSPAPANDAWLDKFMPEAMRRGFRVDFVCVHRYPDISHPKVIESMESMLRTVHEKYGLPVWLTEFGAANIAAWHQPQTRRPTAPLARSFVKEMLAMLESLPFLERYAWFADRVGGEYHLGTIFDRRASRITPLGCVYRDGE
jgi:hypothetical protein